MSEATDGYVLTDGETVAVRCHGIVRLPTELVADHPERYHTTHRSHGRVVVDYAHLSREERQARREAEAQIDQHPIFGTGCGVQGCCKYAAFKCSSCLFARFCSVRCSRRAWGQHKEVCLALRAARRQRDPLLFWFFEIYVMFALGQYRFFEIGNTARCVYKFVESISLIPPSVRCGRLFRSQYVLHKILGYSERESRRWASCALSTTQDLRRDWTRKFARNSISLIIAFVGFS